MKPEEGARKSIDALLTAAGWNVQDLTAASLHAAIGVAIREFPLTEQLRIVAEVDRRLSIVREVEAEVDANLKRSQALRQAVLSRAFGFA